MCNCNKSSCEGLIFTIAACISFNAIINKIRYFLYIIGKFIKGWQFHKIGFLKLPY